MSGHRKEREPTFSMSVRLPASLFEKFEIAREKLGLTQAEMIAHLLTHQKK